MIVGCRAARNQRLKDVMRDYGYLERRGRGRGTPRKIMAGLTVCNGTEPVLRAEEETFTIVFQR